ncbi:MAG: hypothetical protein ABSF98_10245 [Bryobacteraceae bacterium]|jgi:hypothetical protein
MSLSDEDKDWMREQLERLETNLKAEFHKWAAPVDEADPPNGSARKAL